MFGSLLQLGIIVRAGFPKYPNSVRVTGWVGGTKRQIRDRLGAGAWQIGNPGLIPQFIRRK
ncbi:hypothetical protein HMSSN139_26120 [Paenibacillus sp. HMSSN-139]|nr:hypothetical protein HMSSN139_26120 [Paenibacillus sp. HMSSN-139]